MLVTALLVDACKKANVDDVRRYIREGADVNQRLDSRPNLGWEPIHFACQLESSVILAILLENGADPNLLTNDGFPALNIACNAAECSKEMVQMLEQTQMSSIAMGWLPFMTHAIREMQPLSQFYSNMGLTSIFPQEMMFTLFILRLSKARSRSYRYC